MLAFPPDKEVMRMDSPEAFGFPGFESDAGSMFTEAEFPGPMGAAGMQGIDMGSEWAPGAWSVPGAEMAGMPGAGMAGPAGMGMAGMAPGMAGMAPGMAGMAPGMAGMAGMMAPGMAGMAAPGMGMAGMMAPGMAGPGMFEAPAVSPYWSDVFLQALQSIESTMPSQEVMHSLVHQSTLEPTLRDLPAMRRVLETQGAHLDNMAAMAGYIRRLLAGDISSAVLTAMAQQARSLQQSQAECRAALQALMAAEPARASEVTRTIFQVAAVTDQAGRSAMSAVAPLVSGEAPLVSGPEA